MLWFHFPTVSTYILLARRHSLSCTRVITVKNALQAIVFYERYFETYHKQEKARSYSMRMPVEVCQDLKFLLML